MQSDEPIQHGGTLAIRGDAEGDAPTGLEPPDLPPELVSLLLGQALYVALEVRRERQSRRGDQTLYLHVVPARRERSRDRIGRRRLFGNVLEPHAWRSLRRDPSSEGLGDRRRVARRRDHVLLVGEFAARERQCPVVLLRERGDPSAISDQKRGLFTPVVRPRDGEPLRGQKNRRDRATLGELGPRGLERRRVARDTARVRRGEDHPSIVTVCEFPRAP